MARKKQTARKSTHCKHPRKPVVESELKLQREPEEYCVDASERIKLLEFFIEVDNNINSKKDQSNNATIIRNLIDVHDKEVKFIIDIDVTTDSEIKLPFKEHKSYTEGLRVSFKIEDDCEGYSETQLMKSTTEGQSKIVRLVISREANTANYIVLLIVTGENHIETISFSINKDTIADSENITALILAERALITVAREGYTELVRFLIDAGANVDVVDKDGSTALMFAADKGYVEVVKALIEDGANINIQNNDSYTALMFAARANDIDTVKLLIDKDVDLDVKDKDKKTAVLQVMNVINKNDVYDYNKKFDIVQILLESGATFPKFDFNKDMDDFAELMGYEDNYEYCDIICKMMQTHPNIVRIMIERGQNFDDLIWDTYESFVSLYTLEAAARAGSTSEHLELIQAAINQNKSELDIKNSILIAIRQGFIEVLKLLIKYDTNRSTDFDNGNNTTALIFTISYDNDPSWIAHKIEGYETDFDFNIDTRLKMIKILIDAGYDINEKSTCCVDEEERKATPIMAAAVKGELEILEMLLEAGADVNIKDGDVENDKSDNALYYAFKAKQDNALVINMLLKAGVDVDKTNIDEIMVVDMLKAECFTKVQLLGSLNEEHAMLVQQALETLDQESSEGEAIGQKFQVFCKESPLLSKPKSAQSITTVCDKEESDELKDNKIDSNLLGKRSRLTNLDDETLPKIKKTEVDHLILTNTDKLDPNIDDEASKDLSTTVTVTGEPAVEGDIYHMS